eukprot:3420928-Pyramimonas_sp.AAC.1
MRYQPVAALGELTVDTFPGGMVRLPGFHLSTDLEQVLAVGVNQLRGEMWSPSRMFFSTYTVNITRLAHDSHTKLAAVEVLGGEVSGPANTTQNMLYRNESEDGINL